jgi:VWFA-related protein
MNVVPRGAIAAVIVAACVVLPVRAQRSGPTRLYVAAAQDSRLFTLCPAGGWLVPQPQQAHIPIVNGLTLFRDSRGTWDRAVIHSFPTRESAFLYPPADPLPAGRTELDADLPAWDQQTADAIARAVSKGREFEIVDTVDAADVVLLVEAQYITLAAFVKNLDHGVTTVNQLGGDREGNFLDAMFATLVPVDQYRKYGARPASLLPVSLWSGFDLARRGGPGDVRPDEASAAALVMQLHARTKRSRNYPPICGVSPQATGADAAEPIALQPPGAPDAAPIFDRATRASHSGPLFSSGVTYVSVPVVVEDAAGRAVLDLTPSDFHVYEDGTEQPIDRLLTLSASVNLAVVVDTSSSMPWERPELETALRTFIDTLRPDDRVALSSFDDRIFAQADFTSDRARLQRAAADLGKGQGTRLFDAIALVAARRMQAITDRKALVLLTDGVDTRSRLASAESTRVLLSESQVPVYVLQYDTRLSDYSLKPFRGRSDGHTVGDMTPMILPEGARDHTELYRRADEFLSSVTDLTGGRLYRAATLPGLNDAFAQIARELGELYTISYYPTNQRRDGTDRTLRIEVDRPNVQIRTRAGYRASSTAPTMRVR